MNDNKFGLFIKELRNEKGLSQEELGEVLFVHRTTINKWEKGNVIPLNDTLLRISDFFDVSVDELLNGKRNIVEEKTSSTGLAIIDLIRSNKKLSKVLYIFGIAFFSLLLLFLLYYFFTTYDTTHVYVVFGQNENIKMREGLMIVSNDRLYFRVGDFYYNDEKIELSNIGKIKVIYKDNNSSKVLIKGDGRNLFVELSKSKELLIKLLEKNEPLYITVEYQDIKEEIELWYYEDFSNDSIVSVDDNSVCNENSNNNICDEKLGSNIEESTNVENDVDRKIDILTKNGYKYNKDKDLYYKETNNNIYNFYYDNNYLIIIQKDFDKNKYVINTINFNDKSYRVLKKTNSNEELIIKDYCNIDALDENYRAYENFYNKILPHYFRDFLGCE